MSPGDPMRPSSPTRPSSPPDDGELIRWLDGELSADAARAVEEAVASDEGVRARLERLRALSGRTGALLETLDVPPLPPRRVGAGEGGSEGWNGEARGNGGRTATWRRAAVLVLLAGGLGGAVAAATVPGVAERIAGGVQRVVAWVSGARGGGPQEAPGETRVAFPVSDAVFTMTFEGEVDGGWLTVGRAPDGDAVARVRGGGPALRVDPAGLRVVGWGAAMEMEVRVPAAVETIRLRVGEAPERTVSLSSLGGGTLRVPLVP